MPTRATSAVEVAHPLKGFAGGYEFTVPLIEAEHVTDEAGTGFVHTAPGHGREDFDAWVAHARELDGRGINSAIPYTVDENGASRMTLATGRVAASATATPDPSEWPHSTMRSHE